MKDAGSRPQFEPRWPVALTIVGVILLLALLPGRLMLVPSWVAYVIGVAVLAPIAAVGLTAARQRLRIRERTGRINILIGGGKI